MLLTQLSVETLLTSVKFDTMYYLNDIQQMIVTFCWTCVYVGFIC